MKKVELDPSEEVRYRFNLAEEHLEKAVKRTSINDWSGVVQASQLAAENAAKAIIACFFMPSWTHDPSEELKEACKLLPEEFKEEICKLIDIVQKLAPEHGRASYGVPEEGVPPSSLYNEEKAKNALKMACEAVNIARSVLKNLEYTL